MARSDEIRRHVRRLYAKSFAPVGRRNLRELPYPFSQLAGMPPEAVFHSRGCGNPLAFIEVPRGVTVLDLGCGAGLDTLLAARSAGPEGFAWGIDMTAEMVRSARGNAKRSGLKNVRFVKGLMERLPFEGSSMDLVISNGSVNLSPEKGKVFREIFRVLKPGGNLLVCDILLEALPPGALLERAVESDWVRCLASERAFLEGLEEAGFAGLAVRERHMCDPLETLALVFSQGREILSALAARGYFGASPEACAAALSRELKGRLTTAVIYGEKPHETLNPPGE